MSTPWWSTKRPSGSMGGATCTTGTPISGVAAHKKGGPYPHGSEFATDLHDFTITDGSYVEGARKGVATMVKDSKKYASTGGWGFQFWAEGGAKKPQVTDPAKQCFECHMPKKDQDYVYSTYIP